MSGELIDDGTPDAVISCTECGHEERYSFSMYDGDLTYDEWVIVLIEEFDDTHDCEDDDAD